MISLESIARDINKCSKCSLSKTCNKKVPGSGSSTARIMLIGEAPGRNEDMLGKPFVGAAGKFLDELLAHAGLTRKDVFIGNMVKCRPPGNRDPTNQELDACSPFLDEQLSVIKPEVIIPLGRFAMSYMLDKYHLPNGRISELHGKIFNVNTLFGSLKLIPMYHPAAGLYQGSTKEKIIDDWKNLRANKFA